MARFGLPGPCVVAGVDRWAGTMLGHLFRALIRGALRVGVLLGVRRYLVEG